MTGIFEDEREERAWRLFRWHRSGYWWRKGRRKGRLYGFIFCRRCHHPWRGHYAFGYQCGHPLDPPEWDVEYGCRWCDRRERVCDVGLERDE